MRSQAKAPSAGLADGSGKALALALMLLVGFLLTFSSPAQGATGYTSSGQVDFPPGPGAIDMAVDDATGNILALIDGRFLVFRPEGSSATKISEMPAPGAGRMAVDQTTHAVYISSVSTEPPVITRFLSDGAEPPTYTPDPTFTSPPSGSDPSSPNSAEEIGDFARSPMAVDPTTGDLLIADSGFTIGFGKQRISRFTSTGAFVRNFNGSGSLAGPFHHIESMAVDDSGVIYVVDNVEGQLSFGGTSVIERFAGDGTPDNSFDPELNDVAKIGYDSKSGNLVTVGKLDGYTLGDGKPLHVTVLNGNDEVQEFDYPATTVGAFPVGIDFDSNVSGRLYVATNPGGPEVEDKPQIRVFAPVDFPDLTLNPPTAVTATTAHVSGTVNALGLKEAFYRFEYSYDGVNWASSDTEEATGTSPTAVSAELTDLAGNTNYQVRLAAIVPGGHFNTVTQNFSTATSAPGVVTGRATDRAQTSATLNGTVNPYGFQATYHLEYGLTTDYGSRLPLASENTVGSGRNRIPVSKVVTGLAPETTYHYRLVATSSLGTSAGQDRSFTTASASALHRAYEQISPIDKDGTNVLAGRAVQAMADGTTVFYGSKSPIGGSEYETEGGPAFSISLGQRDGTNWHSRGVDPPLLENYATTKFITVFGSAEDGSKSVVGSLKALAPGAVEGDSNLYLRDSVTGAYKTVLSVPGPYFFANGIGLEAGNNPYRVGTPSLDAFLFRGVYGEELLPGAPFGALYEWSDGEVRVASVGPTGEPVGGQALAISDDGSRVVFRAGGVYVRIDGERTIELPAGNYAGSTPDGHYVFLAGADLTPDSDPGVESLYRYDVDAEEIELLTPMGVRGEVLYLKASEVLFYETSTDGRSVYFRSKTDLTGEGVNGRFNLYVWRDGTVKHIAALQAGEGEDAIRGQMSPNGRYLAFATYSKLTEYDNSTTVCAKLNDVEGKNPDSCREIYRYDVVTDELQCASCRPDGGVPTGQAQFRPSDGRIDYGSPHFPRHMLDNGEVFFDTPDALAARDSNGLRDVYSFDGDQATLISTGRGSGESQLGDVTPDGRSVFFTTTNQLVGQDNDSLNDLYVARVDGGLAAQNPPPPRGECIRDDCKSTPNSGPELPFGGSEGLSGPENVSAPVKTRCGKGRQAKVRKGKSRCVKRHQSKAKGKAKRAHGSRRAGG